MKMLKNINRIKDFIRASNPSKRHVTARDSLCHGNEVGFDVKVLNAKPFSCSPEPADDFIDDEDNTVTAANFPHNFPVLLWRGICSKPLLNRFTNKGRDLGWIFELNDSFNVPCTGHVTLGITQVNWTTIAIRG